MGRYPVFRRLLIALLATASLAAVSIAATSQAASAGSRTPREAAYVWAYHHAAGHWYCWGGAGPSCYDCSGVVMAAYAREGIHFGRSTTSMLASGRLIRETARQARRGDLAFYGTGHVEFFIRRDQSPARRAQQQWQRVRCDLEAQLIALIRGPHAPLPESRAAGHVGANAA